MADEHDGDVLELDEPLDEPGEGEPGDDEIEIEVEGEEPQEETPLIRSLRQQRADLARENAELRKAQQPAREIVVGDKPTLESCEYDEARYDAERDAWEDRKRAKAQQERDAEKAVEARNHTFERSIAAYREQAAKLGVNGFAEAEAKVKDALPEVVQSAIPVYFKEPAKLVAALGRSPTLLASIAAEPDQMRQIMMLKDIEGKIKVVNKRRPPEPEAETIQRGSAPLSRVDPNKELARLEKEAERTGDRTKIIAWKRAQKEKAK